jgi:hypothetical protein
MFTLPDGRELSFSVSIAAVDGAFHVDGAVSVESDVLLALPRKTTSSIHDGLAVLDDYAAELAAPAGRFIDQQLDEIV